MARIPIAVQLYSVRQNCAEDLPGTLAAIAKMGYEGVEFAGYYDYSAADLRKMLDDVGLRAAGTHTRFTTLLPDQFEATVEFNKIIGNKYLIVPSLPPNRKGSKEAWLSNAELFNELAEKLQAHGMLTGYHNHSDEFSPIDGEATALEILMSNTRSDVAMQIDIGNAIKGGGDPIGMIKKFPGRSYTVHLKEYSATNDKALVGEGDVDWKAVFSLCEEQGVTDWYIVEQESYPYPPMESIERCLKNLKDMGL
ncbi:MAG TPA: sugar phosphate isomerase/epimerase [Firmicutes bacterium]|nr:sugar phosphate isomerase/epimerase [Bacillota bacterium]